MQFPAPFKYEVTQWEYDKNIFPAKDKSFEIKIDGKMIEFQPIVSVPKKIELLPTIFGIRWLFAVNKDADEIILLEVEDEYSWMYENIKNQKDAVIKIITDSYKKFALEFDGKKSSLGILEGFPLFPQNEADALYISLLKTIENVISERRL